MYNTSLFFTTGSFGFERETPPPNKVIITTSRSHSDRMVTEAVESCNPDEVVRVGGAGHKVSERSG
jgi:3'(2'), 5'-bisphosphate nucleotidase